MRMKFLSALAAALLLSACAAPASNGPTADSAGQAELVALRERYGLPDCPETDPTTVQLEGGLPQTDLGCLGSDKMVNLAGLPRTPTVINLWAQWCGPCRAESGFLREGMAELDGVSFLGINYDDPKPDWALEFADLVGWDYPHVTDPAKTLRAELSVPGLPTTYFVDAEGRIAGVHAGELESKQQLLDLAQQYLGVTP